MKILFSLCSLCIALSLSACSTVAEQKARAHQEQVSKQAAQQSDQQLDVETEKLNK
jgi:uncharacterized protein YceK